MPVDPKQTPEDPDDDQKTDPEDDQEGTVEDLGDDDSKGVQDTPDGGAIVNMDEENKEVKENEDFYRNIAEDLPESVLETLALELLQKIEYDKKSREKRDKQYEEGLRRTGLGDDAPGGAQFQGSSRVVHPMLTEACVDFSSRMISELMPPGGPVKDFIPGKSTKARVEKAQRKTKYMNWQFKVQMPDFRTQLEQLATQLPLGGVQYMRLVPDVHKKRAVPIFVPVDDVYLPYSAPSFYTAERITYVEHITEFEFNNRVRMKLYRDLNLSPSAMTPEKSKAAQANEKIEGKEENPYNEDGVRDVYEVQTFADIEEPEESDDPEDEDILDGDKDTEPLPYLITIDQDSHRVLSVVRNWEEEDEDHKPMFWMAEFPFVPWRGAYAIGLTHMIGGLSAGATGALRALLDSAHINNMPTLMKLKGANFSGQSTEFSVTSVTEVQGGIVGTDDIRKLIMSVPFNPPSMVLYQLLGFLVDAGRGVVRTTFEDLPDGTNPNMPVGTTLALIEQGMKVLSAIHQRLWTAMDNVIRILHRINRMYLTDDEVMDDTGEFMAYRSDFQNPQDVIPTADPEIFSDVQRYAQMQLVAQRAMQLPQLYDLRKVEEMILKRTKIPDAENLLLPAPTPQEMNAVNENVAMSLGRPVSAFPEQDHLAHIQVLLDFMTSPMLGQLMIIAPTFLPASLNHLKEHIVMWYVNENYEMVKKALPDITIEEAMEYKDSETQKEIDKTLAAASPLMIKQAAQQFAKIPQIIAQAQAFLQKLQPPPQDPQAQTAMAIAQMTAQSKQADLAQKAQQAQMDAAQKDKQAAADLQKTAMEQQAEADRINTQQTGEMTRTQMSEQAQSERSAADNQTREQINVEDNTTAMEISAAEIGSGVHSSLKTGTGINKNPDTGV